tara:strand:+ start:1545 stop:2597 length:1053 start_codon:yes stop_codon:yes gene_type:complete
MKSKDQILIVIPVYNSFINNDIDILSTEYNIKVNHYNWRKKLLIPFFLTLQFFNLLYHVKSTTKIIIQFGGYWSLLPSLIGNLFSIPVFIVLHGTDCASIKHHNYGNLRKPLLRLFCNLSYKFSTLLLPVSKSLVMTINNYNKEEQNQGLKHFFPNLSTPSKVIHNGLNIEFWQPYPSQQKEEKLFTAVFSDAQFVLKGGDLILQLAKKFTDCTFNIAGANAPKTISNIPNNVHFLGKLSRENLKKLYNKSQFYFQLSIFEGFGLALCEAMLCECIPIGSSVNIIPDIIGNTGHITDKHDINSLSTIVKEALSSDKKTQKGKMARERIINKYPIDKRRKLLLSTVKNTKA